MEHRMPSARAGAGESRQIAIGSFAAALALVASACAGHMGKNAAAGAAQEVANSQAASADDPSRQVSRVFAQRAMEGALAALDAPEQRARIQHLVDLAAERVVVGNVAALDAPAQREKIQQVVNGAVDEAVSSAFDVATGAPRGERAGVAGEHGVSPVALLMGQAARAAVDDAVRGLIADLGSHGQGPLAASLAGTGKNVSAAVVGSALDQLNELFPGCRGPEAVACVNRQIASMSQSAAIGFSAGLRQTIGWALLIFAGLIGLLMGLLSHWLWSHRAPAQVLRTRTT
jgi:hypothetical protein